MTALFRRSIRWSRNHLFSRAIGSPHFFLESGESLFDLLGKGLTLIALGGAETGALESALSKASVPFDVLRIEAQAGLEALERALVLVRPDQHIAWSGSAQPSDCDGVVRRVVGKG